MKKTITPLLSLFTVLLSSSLLAQDNKIESTGNVGIGTTTPTEHLTVNGIISNGGSDFLLGKLDGRDQGSNTKNRALVHNDKDRLDINFDEDFEGGTYVHGQLSTEGSFSTGGTDFVLGQLDGRDQGSNTRNRALVHNTGDRLEINFDEDFEGGTVIHGSVGIDTSNVPENIKLGVNGKIAATEVQVALMDNWSDFVFYDDYELPTLNEVENHIQEKGHLKDIPSAAEVAENGILLGNMNAKLLQKIEELTLYTIAQQKEIKEQETALETQEKVNEELIIRLEKLESLLIKQ